MRRKFALSLLSVIVDNVAALGQQALGSERSTCPPPPFSGDDVL